MMSEQSQQGVCEVAPRQCSGLVRTGGSKARHCDFTPKLLF
jgi:hypothetical protein